MFLCWCLLTSKTCLDLWSRVKLLKDCHCFHSEVVLGRLKVLSPTLALEWCGSGARQRTKTGINVVQQVLILGSSLSHPMYRMFCQGWHRVRPWHELDAAANHNEVNEDCRWCEGWCERLHDFSGAYETGVLYESSLVKLQTLKIQTECICQNTSFRAPQ